MTLGGGILGAEILADEEDLTAVVIPTFTPPVFPRQPYGEPRSYPESAFLAQSGYSLSQRRGPPVRTLTLNFEGLDVPQRDAILGFVNDLDAGEPVFYWTPLDAVTSPERAPVLSQVAGGALAERTYYVVFTWFDPTYGETLQSARASLTVSASFFLKVDIDRFIPSGVDGWRVYASETSGDEELQATLSAVRTWTQSGALGAGANPPVTNTLEAPIKWKLAGAVNPQRMANTARWRIEMPIEEQLV